MAKNIIASSCSGWLKLDPVEDVWMNRIFPNVCGPLTIAIFKGELVETAKIKSGETICKAVIDAIGKNGVLPAFEFSFNYFEDRTSVEHEPVYSDKDDRFIQDYRFDVSKLEPSAAKLHCPDNRLAFAREYEDVNIDREKKGEISTYIIQAIHEAWMDIDIASKSQDQVKRLILRYLGKLTVINLPILVVLLACATLEKLILTIIILRYPPPSETEFSCQDGPQSIHLT